MTWNSGGSFIHRFGEWPGSQIPDKFFCFNNVLHTVFPAAAGETDDRWPIVKAVEEAVGGEIALPCAIERSDPADGARPDDGIQRVVRQAVAFGRLIEVHRAPESEIRRYPDSLIYRAAVNGYLTRLLKGDCHESRKAGVAPA